MSVNARVKKAKDVHACFSCLKKAGKDHNVRTCNRRKKCGKDSCQQYHHVLLHPSNHGTVANVASEANNVTLPVIKVGLGSTDKNIAGNVMLDSGANVTLIRQDVAEELNLKGKPISIDIGTLGGDIQTHQTKVFKLTILANQQEHTISAIGVPDIANVQKLNTGIIKKMERVLGCTLNRGDGPIDVLVGVDYPLMHSGETKQVDGYLARKSPLGWVMFGSSATQKGHPTVLHVNVTENTDLTRFWSTEEMGVKLPHCSCLNTSTDGLRLSPSERSQFNQIWESCEKVKDKWQIPYPWRKNPDTLVDNKILAERLLTSTENRLMKNPEHMKGYQQQMDEMLELGFSRKLSKQEIKEYSGPVCYLPHHAVIRPEKKSTPVRIVFNSSAKFHGQSLNEFWEKGPDLLNSLFGVLLRFRQQEVALAADISKMYHRIAIPEPDQHVHRFLWCNFDQSKKPDIYVKTNVTFGDKPAPAMAQVALRKTAKMNEEIYPTAAKVIIKDSYMDDILTSVSDEKIAEVLTHEIDTVLESGRFKVKGWVSNGNLTNPDTKQKLDHKPVSDMTEQKVLGVVWDPNSDLMLYKVKPAKFPEKLLTKRMVLSEIASVFDPIGFATAFLIKGKIIMQKLWQRGYGWDNDLSESEKTEWRKFFKDLRELDGISFPRCLLPTNSIKPAELIIFCDASEDAFGAVAYTRWEDTNGDVEVRFISAKSRVAPLKHLSMPRLELQAAVMASRLYAMIKEEISLNFDRVIFFSDSIIALSWIRGQSRLYKSFVANRVAEIQNQTDISDWRHLPGECNIADQVSRAIDVKYLEHEWRNGPAFLKLQEEQWPKSIPKAKKLEREKRKEKKVLIVSAEDNKVID